MKLMNLDDMQTFVKLKAHKIFLSVTKETNPKAFDDLWDELGEWHIGRSLQMCSLGCSMVMEMVAR